MGQRAWITKPTSKRREICGSRVEEIRAVCYCWICRCFIIQGLVWTERREERSRRLCAITGGGVLCTRRTEDVTQGWMVALSLAAVSWESSLVSFGGPRKTHGRDHVVARGG